MLHELEQFTKQRCNQGSPPCRSSQGRLTAWSLQPCREFTPYLHGQVIRRSFLRNTQIIQVHFVYIFRFFLKVLRERECEHTSREGQRGRERSKEPDAGLDPGPRGHDLSPRQTLSRWSHPGAPGHQSFDETRLFLAIALWEGAMGCPSVD